MTWILFFIFFAVCFLLGSLLYAGVKFAPWFPTRKRDLARIQRLAQLQPGQVFYDLGCGTGQVVSFMSRDPQIKAIGIEIVLPLFLFCRLRAFFTKSEAKFIWGNLFTQDLSDADVIFLFDLPETLKEKMLEKLQSTCRPGTRVISYVFRMGDFEPEIIDKPGENDLPIYVYKLK